MALAPRDNPITRVMVADWITAWRAMSDEDRPPINDYIRGCVENLELPDSQVITQAHDYMGEETPVADMIIDDLPSYGIS